MTSESSGLVEVLANGLLGKYEQGFDDAFNAITAGLEASLEKARVMPEAKHFIDGLDTSIYIVNGLKDEFNKVRNTKTETNGENTNG